MEKLKFAEKKETKEINPFIKKLEKTIQLQNVKEIKDLLYKYNNIFL